MKLPGFTAETSLGTNRTAYSQSASIAEIRSFNGRVIASLQRVSTTGCGPCVELKWPNGTGTGACMQDCCDLSGHCEFKACPCGGSGSGLFARSLTFGSGLARF